MQYRAGPDGVVYAFGEREPLRQVAFRFHRRGRITNTLSSCGYARVGAAACEAGGIRYGADNKAVFVR